MKSKNYIRPVFYNLCLPPVQRGNKESLSLYSRVPVLPLNVLLRLYLGRGSNATNYLRDKMSRSLGSVPTLEHAAGSLFKENGSKETEERM